MHMYACIYYQLLTMFDIDTFTKNESVKVHGGHTHAFYKSKRQANVCVIVICL